MWKSIIQEQAAEESDCSEQRSASPWWAVHFRLWAAAHAVPCKYKNYITSLAWHEKVYKTIIIESTFFFFRTWNSCKRSQNQFWSPLCCSAVAMHHDLSFCSLLHGAYVLEATLDGTASFHLCLMLFPPWRRLWGKEFLWPVVVL